MEQPTTEVKNEQPTIEVKSEQPVSTFPWYELPLEVREKILSYKWWAEMNDVRAARDDDFEWLLKEIEMKYKVERLWRRPLIITILKCDVKGCEYLGCYKVEQKNTKRALMLKDKTRLHYLVRGSFSQRPEIRTHDVSVGDAILLGNSIVEAKMTTRTIMNNEAFFNEIMNSWMRTNDDMQIRFLTSSLLG